MAKKDNRIDVINRLKTQGFRIVNEIEQKQNPHVELPTRTLSNVYFDEKARQIRLGDRTQRRTFFNVGQAKKFMQTCLIASQIKSLLEQNQPNLTTRQLFYTLKTGIPGTKENTFDSQQQESDPVIEDVEVMIDVLREQLGLVAVPKGVMAGPITIEDSSLGGKEKLDFTKFGAGGGAIPGSVEDYNWKIKDCTADYILVVEKWAVWNLLNQQKFWDKNNCLLMTGKGQPARAERRLLARFAKELDIPIYCFMDMDIYGYYIYSTYKHGSINLAFFSEKSAAPKAKYLGFSIDDVERFDIPKNSWIPFDKHDLKRISEVKNYDWFKKKEWQEELRKLSKFGHKIESDALVAKKIEFTAKEYLPTKIENKLWLD